MPSYFINLATQYSNLGDEVIQYQLVKALASRGPLTALAGSMPASYGADVRALAKGGFFSLESSPTRFFIDMQVSLLGRRSRTVLVLSPGARTGMGAAKGASTMLLQAMGLALFQVGASYLTLTPAQSIILRRAQAQGESIAVRDARSAEVVHRATGFMPNVLPDLAYMLDYKAKASRADSLLLSFREAQTGTTTLIKRLEQISKKCSSRGYRVSITWQVEEDRAFSKWLARELGLPVISPKGQRLSHSEAKEHYGDAVAVVSNRLHVLILAMASGAIPFAVTEVADQKIVGAFAAPPLSQLISLSRSTDHLLEASLSDAHLRNLLRTFFIEQGSIIRSHFDDHVSNRA